jgi:hypothetical protein
VPKTPVVTVLPGQPARIDLGGIRINSNVAKIPASGAA